MRRYAVGLVATLVLALLVWPLAAAPPVGKIYRIGFLRAGQPPTAWVEAFQQGLQEQGYINGQHVVVDYRVTDGSIEPLPQLAEVLVRSKVDVILASSSPSAVAAKHVTTSVPIVFVNVFDPVEIGLVPSLAHPGGNITGIAATSPEIAGKRLELLRELVPQLRRIAVLGHPATPSHLKQLQGAEDGVRALGIQMQPIPVHGPEDFEAAFQAVRDVEGLLPLESVFFTTHRARLVGLAAASRLPAIYGVREMVDAGGLMSYGVHYPALHRRAATYVAKILQGAKPADLPVERPMKFEFVINLKTAQALGLTVPSTLLFQADEVIK